MVNKRKQDRRLKKSLKKRRKDSVKVQNILEFRNDLVKVDIYQKIQRILIFLPKMIRERIGRVLYEFQKRY